MGEINWWPVVQVITAIVIAIVGWWNRILQGRVAAAEAEARAAAAHALGVERALSAHKLFVAENYTKSTVARELEERIDKRLENIEGMVRSLVSTRRNAGE